MISTQTLNHVTNSIMSVLSPADSAACEERRDCTVITESHRYHQLAPLSRSRIYITDSHRYHGVASLSHRQHGLAPLSRSRIVIASLSRTRTVITESHRYRHDKKYLCIRHFYRCLIAIKIALVHITRLIDGIHLLHPNTLFQRNDTHDCDVSKIAIFEGSLHFFGPF